MPPLVTPNAPFGRTTAPLGWMVDQFSRMGESLGRMVEQFIGTVE
jgi:hypothetical protein